MCCEKCGAQLPETAGFCRRCGASQSSLQNTPPSAVEKTTLKELTSRHLCSPLFTVMAVLFSVTSVFFLIDRLGSLSAEFEMLSKSFERGATESIGSAIATVVASFLSIVAFLLLPLGACLAIRASDRRIRKSSLMITIGTCLLIAAVVTVLGIVVVHGKQYISAYGEWAVEWRSERNTLPLAVKDLGSFFGGFSLLAVYALMIFGTCAAAGMVFYLLKFNGFFRSLTRYMRTEEANVRRIPGRVAAVMSMVLAGMLFGVLIGYSEGISPWLLLFVLTLVATMIVFAVFVLRFVKEARALQKAKGVIK